ncbi:hypothetical protein [Actinokineospora globicatena]|uniref:Ig-like domain-containing protein n=1 Tax=Actinokineospora globicatena TaxID=103729 RepID=A0A9W6QV10_9PSEU|nr:hypothetical protein [Actinokineospora globicatena]GLW95062.1 hypothetical protein Aglo03_58780 [Actinokineospora globicatena]
MSKRALGGLAVGVVLAAGAVGCTSVQAADSKPTVATTSAAEKSSGSTDAGTDSGSTEESSAATGTRKPTTSAKPTTTHKPTTTTTTAAKPITTGAKVVSFTVVSKPACPVLAKPGAPYSSPGAPVVIAWKVTGADGAAISVDSPGMYGSYGSDYAASGQLELSFPCDTTPGKTTHTYTVWPKGAKTVSQSLTVSATNNT